jgi:hypothetical protein
MYTLCCKFLQRWSFKLTIVGSHPGPKLTTWIYSASVVNFYYATDSLARFENYFLNSTLKNALAYYNAGVFVAVNAKVIGLVPGLSLALFVSPIEPSILLQRSDRGDAMPDVDAAAEQQHLVQLVRRRRR